MACGLLHLDSTRKCPLDIFSCHKAKRESSPHTSKTICSFLSFGKRGGSLRGARFALRQALKCPVLRAGISPQQGEILLFRFHGLRPISPRVLAKMSTGHFLLSQGEAGIEPSHEQNCLFVSFLRKERDSNPRYPYEYSSLAGTRLRPLSHLSIERNVNRNRSFRSTGRTELASQEMGFLKLKWPAKPQRIDQVSRAFIVRVIHQKWTLDPILEKKSQLFALFSFSWDKNVGKSLYLPTVLS